MGNTVKFEVSAEVAQAVNAVLKIVGATDKTAEGFNKAAAASSRANQRIQADARATVARIQQQTGSARVAAFPNVSMASGATSRARDSMAREIRSGRAIADLRKSNLDLIGQLSRQDRERRESYVERANARTEQLGKHLDVLKERQADRSERLAGWGEKGMELGRMALAFVGVSAGIDLIQHAADGAAEGMRNAKAQTVGFNLELKELASRGENINNIGGLRAGVLNMSNAWGFSTGSIADLLHGVQTAGGNLSGVQRSEVMRSALQWAKLSGGSPEAAGRALITAQSIFPQSIRSVGNKLQKTSEISGLGLDALSEHAPALLAAGKAMGYGDNELLALASVTSKRLGDPEVAFGGLTRYLLRRDQIGKKTGRVGSGDLVQDLLGDMALDPEEMKGVFGGRSIAIAQILKDNAGEVQSTASNIGRAGASNVDEIAEKLNRVLEDTGMRFTELTEILENLNKNVPLSDDFAKKWGDTSLGLDASQLAAKQNLGPMFEWLAKPLAWSDKLLNQPWIHNNVMGASFYSNAIEGNWKQAFIPGPTQGETLEQQGQRLARDAGDAQGRAGTFGSTGNPLQTAQIEYSAAYSAYESERRSNSGFNHAGTLDALHRAEQHLRAAADAIGQSKNQPPKRNPNAHSE